MDIISCTFPDGAAANLRHIGTDMLVVNEQNQVLLIKRSKHISRGDKYGMPGGYLDRDEDVKTGALRELEEETGYKGKIKFLFCINGEIDEKIRKDNRQNVLLVFIGEIIGGEKKLNDEVTEITWFSEDNLPEEDEFAFDHREIIKKYFEYRKSPFPLPLII